MDRARTPCVIVEDCGEVRKIGPPEGGRPAAASGAHTARYEGRGVRNAGGCRMVIRDGEKPKKIGPPERRPLRRPILKHEGRLGQSHRDALCESLRSWRGPQNQPA